MPSKYSQTINNMCEEFSLTDIWRVQNPDIQKYTRRENSKSGIVQSRLDYFLVSEEISYLIKDTSINIGLGSSKRGKGFWKFNNDLLTDKDYINLIKLCIKNIKDFVQIENTNQLWEYIKCQIRTETMIYSSARSKFFLA